MRIGDCYREIGSHPGPPWYVIEINDDDVVLERYLANRMRQWRLSHVVVPKAFLYARYYLVACPECARIVTVDDLGLGGCPGCGIA